MALTRQARLEGGLVGMLVGDALGVPYEFHDAAEIPPRDAIEMTPPAGFARAHGSVPPGTWSDDGAQALSLLASLLHAGRFDADDFAVRLREWYERGYFAVDGVVFDVGMQTSRAIRALQSGVAPLDAGPAGERDNGNGSLMRVLPLALWHDGSDDELVRDARLQSRITHGHARAELCCALYCLWARRVLGGVGVEVGWSDAAAVLRRIVDERDRAELDDTIRPDAAPHGRGSGYVLDTLHSARLALMAGDYEAVVRAAVALGDDTDTTACVAGGIAGLLHGVGGIPRRWRDQLRGRALVQPLLDQLLRR
jgi:ADP-ribosyl-[dinitrogen reductase] hydrolase